MIPHPSIRKKRGRRATRASLLLAATVVAILVAPTCAAPSSSQTATRAAAEDDEIAASARAAIARMPSEERLAGIKGERLRRAVQTTYRAVSDIANNREPRRVASLSARFERAYAVALREAARADKTCASNCNADGETCQRGCAAKGKKFCGCKLAVFGCLVAECIF
jgi:hypothetical protein